MELDITVAREDSGEVVLALKGAVDLVSRADLVETALRELDRAGCEHLVLDMSGVSFIDSTGLGTLITLANEAETREAAFSVREPSSRVERLLSMTGLEEKFVRDQPE